MQDIPYSRFASKLANQLEAATLPVHVPEGEIRRLFRGKASTFHRNFPAIANVLKAEYGIWGECVLVPGSPGKPRTGYYTFYRLGQESLFCRPADSETKCFTFCVGVRKWVRSASRLLRRIRSV